MIIERFIKQPREVKDYVIGYKEWLAEGDTVNDVNVVIECLNDPIDNALINDSVTLSPDGIKLWMSGGTHGNKYKLTLLVYTLGGRIDEIELIITIKDY